TNQWLSPRGEAILAEERTTRVTPAAAGQACHVIDLESVRYPAGERAVQLGQTKEAGLGLRMLRSEERRVGKECRDRWAERQAEDGIRDLIVTGVQTCALPI